MLGTLYTPLWCSCICGCNVTESVTMIVVSGEGLLRVCTELPSGHMVQDGSSGSIPVWELRPLANKKSGESKKEEREREREFLSERKINGVLIYFVGWVLQHAAHLCAHMCVCDACAAGPHWWVCVCVCSGQGVRLPSYKDAVCPCLPLCSSKQPMQLTSQIDHEINKQAEYSTKQVCPINMSTSSVQVLLSPSFHWHGHSPSEQQGAAAAVFLWTGFILCCMLLTCPLSYDSNAKIFFWCYVRHTSDETLHHYWMLSGMCLCHNCTDSAKNTEHTQSALRALEEGWVV